MISLLLPSRGRPGNVERLYQSLVATTIGDWEMVVRLDADDPTAKDYPKHPEILYIFGPRITLSKCWNECYKVAEGPIYMHAGDDIVFKTPGWDDEVEAAFAKREDRIMFVYGDDGDPNKEKNFGTHGFLHRNWVEAVGYFVPPYFSSDFNDTWLNEVADEIGRKMKVDIETEHMHPAFGKGELDLTHAERIVRHFKDDTPALYEAKAAERAADAQKLKAVMS